MENPIKIIIAEDHKDYREGLRDDLLEHNIQTIGEADNGKALITLLKEGARPDVILLDLRMPEMNGNNTLTILMSVYPWVKVIIVSSYGETVLMEDYIERGAKTYVVKDQISRNLQPLVDAIRKVHKGGVFPIKKDENSTLKFTGKQKEMISYLSEDRSKNEIAESLGITRSAVNKAEERIMEKMNIKTRDGLFSAIFDKGLNFFGKGNRKRKGGTQNEPI